MTEQAAPEPAESQSLRPVDVSRQRIVRTASGLRPYRASGFVVARERIGAKTLVHNYGHGGAGVTLSWGSAALAVDEAAETRESRFAVLGAGAVGLATARLLQQRGVSVSLYARELPLDTTSGVAGALWFPTAVYEEGRASDEFLDRYNRACRIAHRVFRSLVGNRYGVHWTENYFLSQPPFEAGYPGGADLHPGRDALAGPSCPFRGVSVAARFRAMRIDPTVYLDALLRDFLSAGGRLTTAEFSTLDDVLEVPEAVIVNCTGLGSRELFGDHELTPVKGQLVMLEPQPEIDYGYVDANPADLLYMFPRAREIVLGGTYEPGVTSLDVDKAEVERMLAGHRRVAATLVRP
jgi:glycine/D-amino acid oxidase-like deaminating enzyme